LIRSQVHRLVLICSLVLIISGCVDQVFVGPPTPDLEAEGIALVDVPDGIPAPTFGPHSFIPTVIEPPTAASTYVAPLPTGDGPPFVWSETENYLILGTDRRDNVDNWRTDTIIVVGLDRKLARAAVLSIPRDLYLEIPNYGSGRINQVDYIGERVLKVPGGGPALMSTVLSDTFGIQTHHWVRFEMTGFRDIVDAVGGVTVHLDCPFYEPILNLDTNTWEYFTLPAGDVYLDGEAAYWFVRLRLRESDIGRSRRQRQFLWALREQAMSQNLLLRFPELWTAFRDSFTTDLSLFELIELGRFGLSLDPANVRAGGITLRELQSAVTASGASVLIITDPDRVMAVVNGIWDAPAMVDTNRQDVETCAPLPVGAPSVAAETTGTTGGANAAAIPAETTPDQGGTEPGGADVVLPALEPTPVISGTFPVEETGANTESNEQAGGG
jgi:LCP family protein required for cell wall assembly